MKKLEPIKRALSLVLTFALILSMFSGVPLTAFAETLTIDGFTISSLNGTYCELTSYAGTDAAVTIPSELGGYIVQKIAAGAFRNNKTLKSVVLPDSLESLDNEVFYGCTSLESIDFYDGITAIPNYMFYGCTGLTEMTIPEGVTSIGNYAFSGCTNLVEVNLPDSLTTIYADAFQKCGFETIDIPDSVTTLSRRSFGDCKNLKEVGYPASWTVTYSSRNKVDGDNYYNGSPFAGCTALTEIVVDDKATVLPRHAFNGLTSLQNVVLPEGLTKIDEYAFYRATGITSIKIPDSVQTLGNYIFYGCTGLTSMDYGTGITALADSMFQGCTGLTELTIPEGIVSIGHAAFSGCTNLAKVSLPQGLTNIEAYAFESCAFQSIDIPDSVTTMSARAFYNCKNLSSVGYPASWSVTNSYSDTLYSDSSSSNSSPFEGCTALTEITVDSGVTVLPKHAFRNQTSIRKVNLPAGLKEIGAYAFYGCTSLTPGELGESLETIGNYAYSGCTAVTGITLPNSLKTIGTGAFSNCSSLTVITVPDGVTLLPGYVFSNCKALTEVNLPDTLKEIHAYAFQNCLFTAIDIPDSVTTMSARAFYNCTKLSEVGYPASWSVTYNYSNNTIHSGNSSYNTSPFEGCTALTEITVDDGVTTLPKNAFKGHTSLQAVILPQSMTTIEEYAFYGCTSLKQVWIPTAVTAVNSNAFTNCSALTIHGVADSYAQQYAQTNSIPFSTEQMVYERAHASGQIVDTEGKGVADVTVVIFDKTTGLIVSADNKTDANGRWSYNKFIVGRQYAISFNRPGYQIADVQQLLVKAQGATLEAVTAEKKMEQTAPVNSDFTYTVLYGTYCKITGYKGTATEVVIPSEIDGYTVLQIGDEVFRNNTTIQKVMFPETVESVGEYVFYGCSNLTYVGLNYGLTTIDHAMFSNCKALKEIVIPYGVTIIGYQGFYNCSALESVILPETLQATHAYAFENCVELTGIVLPDSITSLDAYTFRNCSKLTTINYPRNLASCSSYGPFAGSCITTVTIPEGVTTIPSNMFRDCTTLREVKLPESVKTISDYAFYRCSALLQVEFSDHVETIGRYAFSNCSSIQNIELPESVVTVSYAVFADCTALQEVVLKGGTTIDDYAFEDCTALTKVELPSTLTKIGNYAFVRCAELTDIVLPDSITSLGCYVFQNCTKLTAINYPKNLSSCGSSSSRGPFAGSSVTTVTIPEGVTAIPAYTFAYCSTLKNVKLPESLTKLGGLAFHNCPSLTEINIPKSLTTCESYSSLGPFGGTSLVTATIPEGMTIIPEYLFYGCSTLRQVQISEGVTTIGRYAFRNCIAIRDIKLPKSVVTVEYAALAGCTALTEIAFPEGVTTIGDYVLQDCTALEEVELPSTLTGIGNYAFMRCSALTELILPDSVSKLGHYVFSGCTKLTEINYPKSLTSCGNNNYRGPFAESSITTVTIPEGVTTIPTCTFAFSPVQMLKLPESVTTVGSYAFYSDNALEKLWIPEAVTSIGKNAFYSCANLTIHGVEGSYAQTYANNNSIPFSAEQLVFEQKSTVSGCVVDKNGHPLEGVTVTLFNNTTGEMLDRVYTTETDGTWSCNRVIVGNSYRVIYYKAGYQISDINAGIIDEDGVVLGDAVAAQVIGVEAPGSDFTYTILNGIHCAITGYKGSATEVLIPAEIDGYTVVQLSDNAFQNNKTIQKVALPATVTTLGTYVFAGCTALMQVSLGGKLTYLGSFMFDGCTSLTEISIPYGVTTIKDRAFIRCSALEKVELPMTLKSIEGWAFENCPSLTQLHLPDSITNLGCWIFKSTNNLTSINFPRNLTSCGNSSSRGPFADSGITTAIIPEGVTAIAAYAFAYCGKLKNVTIPDSVTIIDDYAFHHCTGLTEVAIGAGVMEIGYDAFGFCTTLANIDFGNTLTKIDTYGFRECLALKQPRLPESLTYIGQCAFGGCKILDDVVLPDSITYLGPDAFQNCPALITINIPKNLTSVGVYKSRGPFYGSGISSVTFPEGITKIVDWTFAGCSSLTSIEIPDSVTTIGKDAFRDCTGLKELNLPKNITTIGDSAFYNCTGLKDLNLPESVTTIDDYAFYNCTGLKELNLPKNVTAIGSYAFYNCIGFRMINLNDNLESIGRYAFAGCDGLVSLVLNEKLVTLSYAAFENCENLTAARVPKSVTSFDRDSFRNCSKITIYCYSGSAAHVALENSSYAYFLLDEHEHQYEDLVETAATCTRGGSRIRTCTLCGYNFIEVLQPLGHKYDAVVSAPTCTEKGHTTYTCSVCGDSYKDSYVNALGHSYGQWQVDSEPSCSASGSQHRICAVCGNKETQKLPALSHNYQPQVVAPTCTAQGYTVNTCSACGHTYRSSYVSAKGHSYGDWIVNREATVLDEGSKHRDCSVCNHTQQQTISRVEIDIETNSDYGLAIFTVVNAQSLTPIKNAQVFVSTNSDGENTFTTDAQGHTQIVLPVGKQVVSVYASGCLTRNLNITIKPGVNEIQQIGLSDLPTYEAEITATEMTIEEIEDAGIDTTNPSNQHVYKYELKLEFDDDDPNPSPVPPIITYFNNDGEYLGGYSTQPPQDDGPEIDDDDDEQEKPTVPVIRPTGIRVPVQNQVITVYPVTEYFYLIVRGEITWLKEMFDVEMLVINNSMTDTLENLSATLELPEGLSLAAMVGEQQSLVQQIEDIAGGQSKSVHWYVRGDAAGSYSLKARLQGTVMPFEEPIDDVFVAEDEIQIWAGDAMHLHFEFPNAAYYGEDYPITITLTNVSDITLYNINHLVQIEQGMCVYYSNGTSKIRVEQSQWESIGVREFNPGDKIIIEASVNIFFHHGLFEDALESLTGSVEGIEQLIAAFSAVDSAVAVTDTLMSSVDDSLQALKDFNFSTGEDRPKLTLFRGLYQAIGSLKDTYCASGSAAIDAAADWSSSGLTPALDELAQNPAAWLDSHDAEDIITLMGRINAIEETIQNCVASKKAALLDTIRTALSVVPMRFALKRVIMTEDEDNTTNIPWSYTVINSSVPYVGVSSVSKYLAALTQAVLGDRYEDAMPWYLQLIPALDNPANLDSAIRYIQASKNEITQFRAKDASGKVTFKAWIEPAPKTRKATVAQTDDFILSCDNDTAVFDNGILTFTGNGTISVTPKSGIGGTLYVEDSLGNVTTYQIDVVEQHSCTAADHEVVIAPTADNDGFAVVCCEICGEILEIVTLSYDSCSKHSYGDWTVQSKADCEKAGVSTRSCRICGVVEYAYTDAIGHDYEIVSTAPTCTTDGHADYTCSVCGYHYAETLPATGHRYQAVVTAPSCTAQGYTTHTCVCGDSYRDSYTAATGHRYQMFVTESTETTKGYTTFTCQLCGDSYVENFRFSDVPHNLWSYESIEYAVAKGYFYGYQSGRFGPADSITRQDFVVVLARIAGADLKKYTGRTRFADVKAGSYYEAAVKWASTTGVVAGYNSGKFGVDDEITREQIVTILYRYAKKIGCDTSVPSYAASRLNSYTDAKEITSYAKEAMIWALHKGILSGMTPTTIGPLNTASRGQMAAILMNISKKNILPI